MDRRRSASVLACVSAVLLAVAACSTPELGTPVVARNAAANVPDRNGAPPVRQPLDASRLLSRPCDALAEAQLRSLNLDAPGTADTDSTTAKHSGPSCTWRNSAEASRVAVSFVTGNKNGLADIYRGHAQGGFQAYWIETTVDGYPAVFGNNTDNRKTGNCVMNVGISDTLAFLVDEQDRLGEKSCDRARQAAALVIQTLRAGG